MQEKLVPWALVLGLLTLLTACSAGTSAPPPETDGSQVMSPYGMYTPEATPTGRDCFCSTDPTGRTFCGARGNCRDKACTKNSDCARGQLCLVNNCCGGPQGKGLCVDRCAGECPRRGPFSCGNFPECIQL